jgi:secreted PhoX family phosphatase
MNRRTFISLSSLLPFLGFGNLIGCLSKELNKLTHSQKLVKDNNNIIDLHHSLKYQIISEEGSIMSDGFKVPGLADGMGSFLVNDEIVLVRNHEIVPEHGMDKGPFQNPDTQISLLGNKHYDKNAIGGTTNVVIDKGSKDVLKEYLSLSGTHQNCAGGTTPWGTWLSCEEKVDKKRKDCVSHGYVFEVDPRNPSLNSPHPLKKLGRFNHEAVAFDRFNNAYLTEDRSDGLIYKFIPKYPNNLKEGELFALSITGIKDARNWDSSLIDLNKTYLADWIKIEDYNPDYDSVREEGIIKGATPFARPEGIIAGNDSIYICCTSGGSLKKGQIWKLNPTVFNEISIELWYEVRDTTSLNMPDNITISPWGDLIVCEDNSDINRLWGITTKGKPYLIAQNSYSNSEFAGVCFSPMDNTMFVNLQSNGLTLLINGSWNL